MKMKTLALDNCKSFSDPSDEVNDDEADDDDCFSDVAVAAAAVASATEGTTNANLAEERGSGTHDSGIAPGTPKSARLKRESNIEYDFS